MKRQPSLFGSTVLLCLIFFMVAAVPRLWFDRSIGADRTFVIGEAWTDTVASISM